MRVVLLHGLTGSKRFFAGLEEALRTAPTSVQTLAFDQPGFGESVGVGRDYTLAAQLRL